MSDALTEETVREIASRHLPRREQGDRVVTMGAGSNDRESGRAYLAAMAENGLAVPAWPQRYGGRDASPSEAALIARVLREFAVPDLYSYSIGLRMVGPTLLELGTAEQCDRWLTLTADGSLIWCQLFSEPDAGSDLANVATLAHRDGDSWVLTGQKTWTSRGAYADWGICLARTDVDSTKHAGLSMFAVDMRSPGVEVRPLRQMNGDDHFSETFLTDVVVPDACRIADVGAGWKVASTVLSYERAGSDRSPAQSSGENALPVWLTKLAARLKGDAVLRDRAMRQYAYEQAIRWTRERATAASKAGRPGPEGSGLKLHDARSFKSRWSIVADATGAGAMLGDWDGFVEFLTAPSMSIRGGTDEIQHNIVGERVLQLPAEPRVDRDGSWAESREAARRLRNEGRKNDG